jgi:ABC-type molybdate transport system substrate-binding protein
VILKSSANRANAEKFIKYLESVDAKKILVEYGYHVQ